LYNKTVDSAVAHSISASNSCVSSVVTIKLLIALLLIVFPQATAASHQSLQ
jgi:hypothetical protein